MGRGGHCLQMNGMFGIVLRSLGFDVMSTAARINIACQDIARSPNYKGPSYNALVRPVSSPGRRIATDKPLKASDCLN